MKKNTPKILHDFEAHEVSLVDKGANGKKFFLMKAENKGEQEVKDLVEILENHSFENEDEINETIEKSDMSKEAMAATKASLKILHCFKSEMPKDTLKVISKLAGIDIDEKENVEKQFNARIEKALKYIEEDNQENFKLIMNGMEEKKVEELSKDVQEKIQKSEDERIEIQKKYDALVEKIEKAEQEKKEMIEKAEKEEAIEKASKFEKLSNKEVIADILLMVKKSGSEEKLAAVEEIFKAANAQIEANDKLTEEKGSTNSDNAPKAEVRLNKMAEEMAEKENISFAKAYSIVLDENKDLYKEHLEGK